MSEKNILEDLYKAGLAKHKAGDFSKAMAIYNSLLNRDPENRNLRFLVGDILSRLGNNGLAILILRDLVRDYPGYSEAWCNLGVAYRNEEDTEKAAAAWSRAIKIAGDTAEVCGNMAGLYADTGYPDEALPWCERALKCDPTSVQANWHRSMALLSKQDWIPGWEAYEWRRKYEAWDGRDNIDADDWDGGELKNKTDRLYLHGEQGVGDEIMFLSMMPYVLGVLDPRQITLEVHEKLASLASYTWPGVNVISKQPNTIQDYAAKLPIGSLPKLFWKKAFGLGNSYLVPPNNLVVEYRKKLKALGPKPWVAFAWLGGVKRTNVLGRSIPVSSITPWMGKCTIVSGQYVNDNPEIEKEREYTCLPKLDDQCIGASMLHQAALFRACDHVVTVPQTALHVAGAVGTPCHIIAPERPDWRLGPKHERSPWYDSVRIYRRGPDMDVPAILEKIFLRIL